MVFQLKILNFDALIFRYYFRETKMRVTFEVFGIKGQITFSKGVDFFSHGIIFYISKYLFNAFASTELLASLNTHKIIAFPI